MLRVLICFTLFAAPRARASECYSKLESRGLRVLEESLNGLLNKVAELGLTDEDDVEGSLIKQARDYKAEIIYLKEHPTSLALPSLAEDVIELIGEFSAFLG